MRRPEPAPVKTGGAGVHSPQQPGEAGTDRQRNPARHRLAEAVAAPGPVLAPGMAAARTLAPTQAQPQPGGHPDMPLPENPIHTPVSADTGGKRV